MRTSTLGLLWLLGLMPALGAAAQDAAEEDADAVADAQAEEAQAEAVEAGEAETEAADADAAEADEAALVDTEPAGRGAPPPIVVHVNDDDDEDEEEEPEPEPSPFDPHERTGDKLYHFGVFARGIFVPQYGQNFFVAGGNDALRPAAGAFFNFRQDNLNFMVEVWGASFFNTAPYHGINETDFETEWIESELSVLFVTLVMMYSLPITSWLAFEIGGGLGLGGVFGGLWRTEAYPDPSAAAGWTPCAHPGDPNDPAPGGTRYCDPPPSGGGEGSYQRFDGEPEPYNFSGGVPPLWFWVEIPRIAIRIKPIRQLQIRAEAGFAIYGIQFGASLALGF